MMFGHWIDPTGRVIEMTAPQHHGRWIIDHGFFPADLGGESVTEREFAAERNAVLVGWIGLTIGPEGNSLGIRHRPSSVERKAATALVKLVTELGFDDKEVYSDYERGRGKLLAAKIRSTAMDSTLFPTREEEVHHLRTRLRLYAEESERLKRENEALSKPLSPDWQRLRDLIRQLEVSAKSIHGYVITGLKDIDANTTPKKLLGRLEYYLGHETSRAAWYIEKHLVRDLRDALHGIAPENKG